MESQGSVENESLGSLGNEGNLSLVREWGELGKSREREKSR